MFFFAVKIHHQAVEELGQQLAQLVEELGRFSKVFNWLFGYLVVYLYVKDCWYRIYDYQWLAYFAPFCITIQYVHINVTTYIYIYVYVCIIRCIYIYVYVYNYIHTYVCISNMYVWRHSSLLMYCYSRTRHWFGNEIHHHCGWCWNGLCYDLLVWDLKVGIYASISIAHVFYQKSTWFQWLWVADSDYSIQIRIRRTKLIF